MNKEIDAAIEAFEIGCKSGFAPYYEDSVVETIQTALKALKGRSVDVEDLKMKTDGASALPVTITSAALSGYDDGWNDCIDFLQSQGYLNNAKDPDGSKEMAQAYQIVGNIVGTLDVGSPEIEAAMDYLSNCEYKDDFLPWGCGLDAVGWRDISSAIRKGDPHDWVWLWVPGHGLTTARWTKTFGGAWISLQGKMITTATHWRPLQPPEDKT